MKLRLYHHRDGARVAYREAGTGPGLALLHSAGLSHREFEPLVEGLAHRFRIVLPDLPLHGHSEDRPAHPYTPDWLVEVISGFIRETCGPRPLVGGHDVGAQLLVRAVGCGRLDPARMVLLPSALHQRSRHHGRVRVVRAALRAGAVPGLGWMLSHALPLAFRPSYARRLTVRPNPAATDLLRHSLGDLGGNAGRVKSWSRAVRRWPPEPQSDLLDAFGRIETPVLLLWADRDPAHPLEIAEEALDLLPDADLRVLSGTGFLIAYDDPVGVAREIAAFCG